MELPKTKEELRAMLEKVWEDGFQDAHYQHYHHDMRLARRPYNPVRANPYKPGTYL